MDGELDEKIKEIGGLLGINEIPDGIGDIIGAFLGDGGAKEQEQNIPCEDKSDIDPLKLIDMFSKVNELRTGSQNDSRIRLLKALKPFLSEQRKQKVDNCVNMIMLKEIAPLFGK